LPYGKDWEGTQHKTGKRKNLGKKKVLKVRRGKPPLTLKDVNWQRQEVGGGNAFSFGAYRQNKKQEKEKRKDSRKRRMRT